MACQRKPLASLTPHSGSATPYLSLRDTLGPIYTDARFDVLFARDGQPAACPWRFVATEELDAFSTLSP